MLDALKRWEKLEMPAAGPSATLGRSATTSQQRSVSALFATTTRTPVLVLHGESVAVVAVEFFQMGEETLASAVAVPQPEEQEQEQPIHNSPETGRKRRQSSVSDIGGKRRRISEEHDRSPNHPSRSPPQDAPDPDSRKPSRRGGLAAEERKRSQRLFGGLLGTLSQSSSSVAEKRRADIEQRQQAKLRLQDERHSEARRKKKEDIVAERQAQQKELEKEQMTIRHKNLLHAANFLRTKSTPVLLWLPYQVRPEDDDIIDRQIEEVKETISKEEAEFEERWHPEEDRKEDRKKDHIDDKDQSANADTSMENGESTAHKHETGDSPAKDTHSNQEREPEPATVDTVPSTTNEEQRADNATHTGSSHRHEDDGEEVMEDDKEDMVIY
ncbi:pinin/SDK/memA/ protein conserved region-domain-containing protein [Talaromyces proteolyticus]|uniref:Pinin/SDK/memA/ protein conserved region-domain-containing protein n=1 Tax=Talaromyces proteolyticus TaxID=1131652 RepID=A0AAD4L276_9EURO|nr:pinin/SDK/memA/ protein conserved region-domain-containing protein [Talaromyces proteolyticus]KAH8705270.1 pinin/SDK/memA/ protein conserved region-domain-containing protein [Talaromyces proteolyticus]